MPSKVKTTMPRSVVDTTLAPSTSPAHDGVSLAGGGHLNRPAKKLSEARCLPALITIPLVLVSALGMSLNLAAPAQAHVLVKKPLKSKLAEATPAVSVAAVAVAAVSRASQAAPTQYVVEDGDTVSSISARFGLSTVAVLALNGLDSQALIFPDQVLVLTPELKRIAAPAASAGVVPNSYTVRSGDTISAIATAHGLATGDVLGTNGLSVRSVIYPGQVVRLASAPAMEAAVSVAPLTAARTTHTIASGETITAVAKAAGVSVQAVLEANGLGWTSIIYPGQVLNLPEAGERESISAPPASITVATAGRVTPMSEEMRHNAKTIVSVGRGAGVSNAGLVIALAAAAQESGLRNVNYGDRDSLGLFQQRPSAGWGTPEQVMDPVRASLSFFGGASNPNPNVTRGLLDIAGWQTMTVTEAAQAVQISAYPDYYAKWETSAQAWLSQIG